MWLGTALTGLFLLTLGNSVAMATSAQLITRVDAVNGGKILSANSGCTVRLKGVDVDSLEYNSTGDNVILNTVAEAVTAWNANVIRLPLSQDYWFGCGSNISNYQALVDGIVNFCLSNNAYVLLDLHWSGNQTGSTDPCGAGWGNDHTLNSGHQLNMPDDNSVTFWSSVAARYANNPAVLFDLYNEPHDDPWLTWRNGGTSGSGFHTPGLQALLNTIRNTGANNVVVAGGLNWAYDLTGIVNNSCGSVPCALTETSTGNGIIYATHIYPWKGTGAYWTPTDGNTYIAVAGQYPIFVGEFGEGGTTAASATITGFTPDPDVNGAWMGTVLSWMDSLGISGTAWDMNTGSSPILITDWAYTPSAWEGVTVKSWLSNAVPVCNLPTYTPTSTDTPCMVNGNTCTPSSTFTPTVTNTPTSTPTVTPTVITQMIDNFETIGTQLTAPFTGTWQSNVGNSSTEQAFYNNPPGANGTNYAMKATGTLVASGWAQEQANLYNPMSLFNASGFVGIGFWFYGDGNSYRIDINTTDVTNYDWWGYTFTPPAGVWTYIQEPFSLMTQQGFGGGPAPFNLAHVKGIQFDAETAGAYNYQVDEIMFYTAAGAYYTNTPTSTFTPTLTNTPCMVGENTCTSTFTSTPTSTFTVTPTFTPTTTFTITDTPSPTATPFNQYVPYPNPWPDPKNPGSTLKFYYQNDQQYDQVQLKIFSLAFRKLYEDDSLPTGQGPQSYSLLGMGQANLNLANGLYYFVIISNVGGQPSQKLMKVLILR